MKRIENTKRKWRIFYLWYKIFAIYNSSIILLQSHRNSSLLPSIFFHSNGLYARTRKSIFQEKSINVSFARLNCSYLFSLQDIASIDTSKKNRQKVSVKYQWSISFLQKQGIYSIVSIKKSIVSIKIGAKNRKWQLNQEKSVQQLFILWTNDEQPVNLRWAISEQASGIHCPNIGQRVPKNVHQFGQYSDTQHSYSKSLQ